ncbi:unnamed protein product, partial [Prunus brigantina]
PGQTPTGLGKINNHPKGLGKIIQISNITSITEEVFKVVRIALQTDNLTLFITL